MVEPIRPPLVLVWLDALTGDVFRRMYYGGELPNLEEYFERGVFVETAVSCFPTVSESSEGGIISGFLAGETNMLGERYYSRRRRSVMHYKFNARPEEDFRPELRNLVIDRIVGDSVGMGRLIYTGFESIIDIRANHYEKQGSLKIVERRIEVASRVVRSRRPRLLFFTISADYISHVDGKDGPLVREFVKRFDREFPALTETLDETYGHDRYAIFVFSDHGLSDVSRHLDLPNLLEEYGFKPAETDLLMSRDDCNAAALSNGRRSGLVYIAHPEEGWRRRPSYRILRNYPLKGVNVDVLRLLAEEEGIGRVFAKCDEFSVAVISSEGEARILYNPVEERFRYRVVRGEDPLGYTVSISSVDEEGLLRKTHAAEFPDAILQVYHLFDSENCGDIVLDAARGWDFWEPWDVPYPTLKAAHGGLSRDEMSSFILARGPMMERGVVAYARIIDLFATVAAYYGATSIASKSHAVERLLSTNSS